MIFSYLPANKGNGNQDFPMEPKAFFFIQEGQNRVEVRDVN